MVVHSCRKSLLFVTGVFTGKNAPLWLGTIPLLKERPRPNFTAAMSDLTARQKELLHKLFSPDNIKALSTLVNDSTETDWSDLYAALISEKSDISATVYIDGASEPHNFTAGIGGIFFRDGVPDKEFYSFSENIGSATNNEAEYTALIRALELSLELNISQLTIFSDSELIVKQINLEYKVKNERLQKLHSSARAMLAEFVWTLQHVSREKNKKADALSKQALTKEIKE
tara:strand:- start:2334 stop:3020 length:687 start_codon:yes stop_codon:yes gene_type:complete